ncbi:MAG TPA: methyltransferase, TIGR04325 family [Bacteroidales bacterium]|nr:methyltransferase, TIGR04325 family [Bacteroidales bacterium]
MTLSSIIKAITPPFLFKQFRKLLTHRKRYKTYSEALIASSSSKGYEDPYLVRTIFEETKEYQNSLKEEKEIFIDQTIILTLLPFSLIKNKETINILDIGGACGIHFYPIKKIFNEVHNLKWTIVETEALTRISKPFESEDLKFFSNVDEAAKTLKDIDLIIASGVIQYCENPKDILTKITRLGAEFVLITRLSLTTSKEEIITVQRSLLSQNSFERLPNGTIDRVIKYPHTTISESDFNAIIQEEYKIKLRFEDQSGILKNNSDELGYGLLLQKK